MVPINSVLTDINSQWIWIQFIVFSHPHNNRENQNRSYIFYTVINGDFSSSYFGKPWILIRVKSVLKMGGLKSQVTILSLKLVIGFSKTGLKFLLAQMVVLPPGSVQAWPTTQPPINTSGYFPAHMSAKSPSNISPNPLEVISEVSEP